MNTSKSGPSAESGNSPLKFRFHYLNGGGQATAIFKTAGSFDGQVLRLGKTEIPIGAVQHCRLLPGRLELAWRAPGGPQGLAIAPGGKGKALVHAVNAARSAVVASAKRQNLEAKGRGGEFRAIECGSCTATLDLTPFAVSPQVFCDYCEALCTVEGDKPKDESAFRICHGCGFYGRPADFTKFYFYFLLVVYGFSWQRLHICHSCMRKQVWKMLLVNIPFVLGVPVALVQITRAYAGGAARSAAFAGLDGANALAKARRAQEASAAYSRILERVMFSAGVRYNQGLSMMAAGRANEAVPTLEDALEDCANYTPAARALMACYQEMGRKDDAARLVARWQGEAASAAEGLER